MKMWHKICAGPSLSSFGQNAKEQHYFLRRTSLNADEVVCDAVVDIDDVVVFSFVVVVDVIGSIEIDDLWFLILMFVMNDNGNDHDLVADFGRGFQTKFSRWS